MFKNTFNILFFLCIITLSIFAQEKWISFYKQERTKPNVNLTISNRNNVSFIIQINGISVSERKINKSEYQNLFIPDAEVMTNEGSPQVPIITQLIAIPDCDDASITITPSNQKNFKNYNIIPSPKHIKKKWQDGSEYLDEEFEEDKAIYSMSSDFPGKYGEIIEIGYCRDQKVARIAIYPVQFNPAGKEITVFTDFNISLSFTNPTSDVNRELGIFRNMMNHAALNYELHGINASSKGNKIRNIFPSNSLNKSAPTIISSGSVTRVNDLSTLVGSSAIPVDYLIITHSSLFNSSYLDTFANWRRDHNGYDVVICQVDATGSNNDIYDFEDTPGHIKYPSTSTTRYVSIHDFIADVKSRGIAHNTGDGHLGYVCLIGDANFDNATEMLPSSHNEYTYWYDLNGNGTYTDDENLAGGSDYYYACVTGSDNIQDLMYGRLSVGNETDLLSIVNKITAYETAASAGWQNNITFVSHAPWFFSDETSCNSYITQMANLLPLSKFVSYGWRGFNADTEPASGRTGFVHHATTQTSSANVAPNRVDDMWFRRFTGWKWTELGVRHDGGEFADPLNLCGAGEMDTWLINRINAGQHTIIYEGHGHHGSLGGGEGAGRRIFRVDQIGINLTNTGMYPFIISNSCETGYFDLTSADDMGSVDCIAEVAVNLPNLGAIAFLGSTRSSFTSAFNFVDRYVLEAQYNNLSHLAGEAVMEMKLRLSGTGTDLLFRRQYNLYGDPAVNLFPTGYTITEPVNLSGNNTISETITVNSTLTIAAGSNIRLENGASIVVANGGTLIADGGTAATPITFDFVESNFSTQNGVKFNSGSNGTISYCIFDHGDYGILENGVSINLSNSAFRNCQYGIYLINSSPIIQNNNFHHNASAGIYLIQSSPFLYNNHIQNNANYGIFCSTSSNPKLGNSSTQGKNDITGNWRGISTYNLSRPMLGQNSPLDGGYNNIEGNSDYNLYSTYQGTIWANNNWWGTTNPAYFKLFSSNGSIAYTPYRYSRVSTPAAPLSKSNEENNIFSDSIPSLNELIKAFELFQQGQLMEARKICLKLINLYPINTVSYNALFLLKETFTTEEAISAKETYKTLFNRKEMTTLNGMAGLILADLDKQNKIQHLDNVISKYKTQELAEYALFDKFIFYYFEQQDEIAAKLVLNDLDNLFTNSIGANEAHKIIGEHQELKNEDQSVLKENYNKVPEIYNLLDNYPNPFNPSTTISYNLPEPGFVTVKIYNIIGKEVATIVNEFKQEGHYSSKFNANNLASGLYLYELRVNDFCKTKKMILLK